MLKEPAVFSSRDRPRTHKPGEAERWNLYPTCMRGQGSGSLTVKGAGPHEGSLSSSVVTQEQAVVRCRSLQHCWKRTGQLVMFSQEFLSQVSDHVAWLILIPKVKSFLFVLSYEEQLVQVQALCVVYRQRDSFSYTTRKSGTETRTSYRALFYVRFSRPDLL